jgi:hypothetical protein
VSLLDVDVIIRDPRADDLGLSVNPTVGSISLRLSGADVGVRFTVGYPHTSDRAAEAEAMDKLAELATEAAQLLRDGGNKQ